MIVWRLSNYADLQGLGGERASGRWHTRGPRIVYFADHPAAAVLETLVHLEIEPDDLPEGYKLLEVFVPGRNRRKVGLEILPDDWTEREPLTRSMGDRWLREARSLLLEVPSAVVPRAQNFLLNPRHPVAGAAQIKSVVLFRFDPRLLDSP